MLNVVPEVLVVLEGATHIALLKSSDLEMIPNEKEL